MRYIINQIVDAIEAEIHEAWTESDADFIRGMEYAVSIVKAVDIRTDSDTISRQAAIDAIDEYINEYKYNSIKRSTMQEARAVIEQLPSAEPKTGEWMRLEREENVYDLHGVPTWGVNYMCDKCGFITTAIQDHFGQYKWCPSCGARMKGGAE